MFISPVFTPNNKAQSFYGYAAHFSPSEKRENEIVLENKNACYSHKKNAYYAFPQDKITNDIRKCYRYIIIPTTDKHNVTLLDSGNHAKILVSLFSALTDKANLHLENVELSPKGKEDSFFDGLKDLSDLEQKLKDINNSDRKPEYLIIPTTCSVNLLNLNDRIKQITGRDVRLRPENIDGHKEIIFSLLKTIHDEPEKYREQINYMDPNGLGMEHVWGVIQEINKCVNSGINVMMSSGHPYENSLKYKTNQKGIKEEYYHYIATGEDVNNTVKNLKNEIHRDNWYDFKLLTLSDARVIGPDKPDGTKFVQSPPNCRYTEHARGTFNLYPIRKNGEVAGYSYTDQKTIQIPKGSVFYVPNLERFVGKNLDEVIADKDSHFEMRNIAHGYGNYCENRKFKEAYKDKLFKISSIFSKEELKERKYDLLGKYIDSDLKLVFDVNDKGEVIFQKTNCEGSQRPSVFGVWGSCMSSVYKTAEEINKMTKKEPHNENA